jgi:hypothetical protein
MSTWTTISDTVLEPGKPIRSVDALALRDNPVAIAGGASGAPRIDAAALKTGNPERDWVLARTAGASVGAVGTYVVATIFNTSVIQGSTFAGSSLRIAGIRGQDGINPANDGTTASFHNPGTPLTGTWRAMGRVNSNSGTNAQRLTLFLRIS